MLNALNRGSFPSEDVRCVKSEFSALSGMMDKRLLLRGACGVAVVFLAIAVVDAALDEGTTRGARGDNGLAFMAANAVRFDADDDFKPLCACYKVY